MKKLYTLAGLAIFGLSFSGFAQSGAIQKDEVQSGLTSAQTSIEKTRTSNASSAKGSQVVYFNEDFSNGLDGMGSNGAWSTGGDQGGLWFLTFPQGDPGGYNTAEPVPGYGDFLPNYFGTRTVVNSPTRDNGVMFLDADRFNSTATAPGDPQAANTTSNPLFAELESPIFDLSGVSGAALKFNQYVRLCCAAGSAVSVGFSTDGGATYFPFDASTPYGVINANIETEVFICLAEITSQTPDLSQCRIKFSWDGAATHYFWQIDDVQIVSIPNNDIAIGDTYFDTHRGTFADVNSTYLDYYNTLEIQETPDYLLKPIQIGAIVSNTCSANPQTNVVITAVVTGPDGSTQEIQTAPVTVAVGESDTIYADEAFLSAFPQSGQYTITFSVDQAEDDDRPDNNIGVSRGFVVTNDADNGGFAVMQNGGTSYNGTFNQPEFSQDAIINAPYTFPDPQVANSAITHIEAVFLNSAGFAVSVPGEVVYFNVRLGSIGDEDPLLPETTTTTVFEPSTPLLYESADLEYTLEETGLWDPTAGFPQNYVGIELPSPILIEPNQIYGAELRLPAAGGAIAYIPVSSIRAEAQTIWLYNFSGANIGWGTSAGDATPSIRFRTNAVENISEISYEAGIKLVQNYPNPVVSTTQIQYQLDETGTARFEVFDISGRLVYQRNLGTVAALSANTITFDRTDLAAGTYTYSIVSNNERVSRKMTIQ